MLVLLVLLGTKYVLGANILHVSMVSSPSHQIWNRVFALGLAKKGHNVTLVDLQENLQQSANCSHIYVEGPFNLMQSKFDVYDLAESTGTQSVVWINDLSIAACEEALHSSGLQQLLNYPPTFKFNYPPTIATSPWPLPSFLAYSFGNPLQSSHIPWYDLPNGEDMSLIERFWNYVFTYGEIALKSRMTNKLEEKLTKTFGDDIPPLKKLKGHISLLLSNHDLLLNYPQALTPNIIPVGGLHIASTKELPKELESVLDGAKNGVIVFSLGSNLRSNLLDKKVQRSLLEAFSKLSEIVVWKFESEIGDLPKNVIVRKWLPQNDILAHPNVKLFIGHGGALSTQEAIYHGVPMVCIPCYLDQNPHAAKIVSEKLGLSLDYKEITTENFLGLIREVIDNSVYRENMKNLSRLYRDRKESPLERGIFWAEYAMRHNGCQILNTPARDLSFYQALSLDIVVSFIALCVVMCFLLYKIAKRQ
ncbi:UDP-glycosyltransferase UGT5-like isoform X2 [Zophobas morio]|uniref:UDP-glycosyltransferase UGT5-like isoform X2 n=1 Tax=Zophobas morio TaxID=2755281 RepID=UPI0030835AB3